MKVGIIGGGISGMVAARKLHQNFDVTLFEANSYLGGHTNTINVSGINGQTQAIDTGFIVFNDATYPNFIDLLNELDVKSQSTEMSFSVHCESTGLEYRGVDLKGLFAQKRNIVNPKFYRMLFDFFRFNRDAEAMLKNEDDSMTIGQFFAVKRYSEYFREKYFIPMGSAVWSCPPQKFREFPIRFIVEFYKNHGMLSAYERPNWKVIVGGSREYVKPLIEPFRDRVKCNSPVKSVRRSGEKVGIILSNGSHHEFDHVIFACHSNQALKILDDPTNLESEILSQFPYEPNEAVLHTDTSVLPKRKSAWASWNYRIGKDTHSNEQGKATVTYNMNILQGISAEETYCVTLNGTDRIDSSKIIRVIQYEHPFFKSGRTALQSRHVELFNQNRTSFCGAYWGNGFHEDGVNSALAVSSELTSKLNETHDSALSNIL